MDLPVIKKKARLDSSSRSSISLSPTDSKVDSGPSHKDVVLALAPFVCTEIKKTQKGRTSNMPRGSAQTGSIVRMMAALFDAKICPVIKTHTCISVRVLQK